MHLNYNKSKLHEQIINDRISKIHRTFSYGTDNYNDSTKFSTSNYNNPFANTNYPFITPSTTSKSNFSIFLSENNLKPLIRK